MFCKKVVFSAMAMALAGIFLASPEALASNVTQRIITQVNVVEVSGVPNVIVKIQGGVPSNCSDKTAYIRPLTDEIGKHLLATALTALLTGKLVDVLGNSSCGAFNVERMIEIRVYR